MKKNEKCAIISIKNKIKFRVIFLQKWSKIEKQKKMKIVQFFYNFYKDKKKRPKNEITQKK